MTAEKVKSTYELNRDGDVLEVHVKQPADFVMVDLNQESVFISFTFYEKPYDEMVTLSLTQKIDTKASSYEFKRDGDKLLRLRLVKLTDEGDPVEIKQPQHKFIDKPNHPKADPRGYNVKKPAKKDWDKIVATLDDSEEEDPDANTALKKIYDGCDDDTKRAMEKSLYESKGTVLNMNWGEVGKKRIEEYKSTDKFEGFDN